MDVCLIWTQRALGMTWFHFLKYRIWKSLPQLSYAHVELPRQTESIGSCNSTCGSVSAPVPHAASAHVLISINCNQTRIWWSCMFYWLLCDLTSRGAKGMMAKWSDWKELLQSCWCGHPLCWGKLSYLWCPVSNRTSFLHRYTGNFPFIHVILLE